MWYELIPPLILVGAVAWVPQAAAYYLNQYFLGNPMRRDLRHIWDRNMFTRDGRLHGLPWRHTGLENIPDE